MRMPVHSSLLSWVDYDAPRRQLRVRFRTGERYLYFQVPVERYHDLLHADSKGAFFNRHIRNHFPYQHLSASTKPIVLIASGKTK